jgi:hypothetical protein
VLTLVLAAIAIYVAHTDAQQAHRDAQQAHHDEQGAIERAHQDAERSLEGAEREAGQVGRTGALTDEQLRRIIRQIEDDLEDVAGR